MPFVRQNLLRTSQPQEVLSWDKASLGSAVLGIFNPGASLRFGAKDPTTLGGTVTVGGAGRCIDYPGNTKTQYPFDANVANGMVTAAGCSLLAVLDVDTLSNYGCIFSLQDTVTQKCALEFRIGRTATDSMIWASRGTSAAPGAGAYRAFDTGVNRIAAGDRNVRILISFADNDVQTVPILIINGTQYTMSASGGGSGTGTVAAPTSNGVSLGGRSSDTVTPLDGRIYLAVPIGRAVTADKGIALTTNPWRALEPEDIWIWVPEALAGITLVGDTSTQSATSSAAAVTQAQALGGASSEQAATSSAAAITQDHVIAGAASTQVGASSGGDVTQTQILIGADAAQNAVGGSGDIVLGVVTILSGASCSQQSGSAVAAVGQTHAIVCAPSVQDAIASRSSIVQAQILQGSACTSAAVCGYVPVDEPEATPVHGISRGRPDGPGRWRMSSDAVRSNQQRSVR